MSAEHRVAELKAEIARIQAKRSASSDKDIQEALQFKEDALNGELKVANAALEAEKAAMVAVKEPTIQMSDAEVEKEIRLARAHIAGDRKPAARDILTKLEEAAPNNIDVLELKADLLILNRDYVNAKPILQRALKLDPKNVTIEKKLAEVSFRFATIGSVDDQLRAGLGDSPFLTDGDMKASATAATVCSVLLPGLGHLVVGWTTKGVVYLVVWLATIIPFSIMLGNQLSEIHGNMHNFNPSMPMIVLGFLAGMCYFVALFECAALGKGKSGGKRPPVDRPKPPVDLPFE